eukprot:m.183229 g.183229  ORF g.183229 m.183229 type:complete len:68 (+) comp39304_c0_seq34:1305-1508(+)
MNELISNGSNVEAVNKDGETSFLIAAKYGHLNLISTLNARGCNIRAKSKARYRLRVYVNHMAIINCS